MRPRSRSCVHNQPINPRHVLVIPETHVADFDRLDEATYHRLMATVRRLAPAVRATTPHCQAGTLPPWPEGTQNGRIGGRLTVTRARAGDEQGWGRVPRPRRGKEMPQMLQIETSVVIDRPVEDVFAVLRRPAASSRWRSRSSSS
jgi:hypothetical protein